MSENQAKAPKTATERLNNLENAFVAIHNSTTEIMNKLEQNSKDLTSLLDNQQALVEANRLLNNQVLAIISLSEQGLPINETNIKDTIIPMNVEHLKSQVSKWLEQKVLVPSDTVTSQSFIVTKQRDSQGNVTDQRLQFSVNNLPETAQVVVVGSQVGNTVTFQGGGDSLEILEIYSMQLPEAPTV